MSTIASIVIAVFASTGFWSLLQAMYARFTTKKSAEQKLLLGIAFKDIVELCRQHLEDGYITHEEYKELHHYLYEPYKEMGGNGTVDKLMKEIDKLPMKEGQI